MTLPRRATLSPLAASLALVLGASAAEAEAQQGDGPAPAPVVAARVPFGAGERMVYDVKFGAVKVGSSVLEVKGTDVVRGRTAWHIQFSVSGGTLFYKVRDRYESWFDIATLSSLRYRQDIDEGSYEKERTFEIFPERATYRENDKPEVPSVAEPLDDGSFLYFLRTVPLEVGETYSFDRYFKPDRNPVTIKVLRRERIQVPAGTFDAIVVQPIIKSKGIFSEGGRAEVWLADDATRAVLQLKSRLKFGSLNMYLRSIRPSSTPGEPMSAR